MSEPLRIKDVTGLAAFEPAIKLQSISVDLRNRYFKDYILTEDLASVFEKMLSSVVDDTWGSTASALPTGRRRSHLISAQYGAGKSYFLTILSALLDASGDLARLEVAKEKFRTFRKVHGLLGELADKRFLIVQISAEDKGDIRFKELLIRSLLDQVAKILPDVVFSNEYTEAISHLEELETSPIGPVFARVLQEHFAASTQQLRARLGSYDRDALRVYYQACERAIGRKVSRDVLDVETTFRDTLDLLKPKGYTHIVVVVDELTAYLRASAGHHSLAETLGELQSFAAYCNKTTSRCLFVGAMHVTVQEFLQDLSQQKDYDKMRGRFEEHAFPLYSSKLLAGVFQPKENQFDRAMGNYRGQAKELSDLISALKITDDGQPTKLSAFFPLHPAVVSYLPRISRELGQAERTSFGFIDAVVRPKLEEPLAKGNQLNLVTLDQVFDYFLPAMEQKTEYVQIISALNTVQSKVSSHLAHTAFKPLALLYVASRVRSEEAQYLQTDLSADQVANFVNTWDTAAVVEALQLLCKTGYVYFDPSRDKYFYSHADPGWDLETEIQKEMVRADPNEVLRSELLALGSRVSLRVPETVTVKVDRSVESEWIDIAKLEETSSIKPRRAEAKLVFVVPNFGDVERYQTIFSDVSQKARDLSQANVVVAIPKKLDTLNPAELRRYRALQEIGKRLDTTRQGGVNEHRVRVTRARFSEVQTRVQRDLEAFGQSSNFIFFIGRQPHEAQDVTTVLTDMFGRYYYKFPKVKVERINGRSTTNALIDSCIVNPQCTFPSDTSEVARQARDTLQVLGLCTWEKGAGGKIDVRLKEPEPGSEGFEIWKIVSDTLTDSSRPPLATLYKRLSDPPYGLPSYMVELYIAAASSKTLKRVYILDKNRTMPLVGKDVVAEITRRLDKDFQVIAVQEASVSYTYICSVWQAIDEALGLRYYQELEKNLGRTVDDQKTWFALKSDSNNFLQNHLAQVVNQLASIEAESKALATLIKHLEQARRIFIPAQGFEELAALGEELAGSKVSRNPDAAALAVRGIVEASGQFSQDWEELQAASRQFGRLQQSGDLERFGAIARATDASWQAYRLDALSSDKRRAFLEQFRSLWTQYAELYVDEHNVVAQVRTNFGQAAEKSLAFELIGLFGSFGFGGMATQASFAARIKEGRQLGCRQLSKEAVRDFKQFGRLTCASCSYRLGTASEVLAQLQQGESGLFSAIGNALDGYLMKLAGALASVNVQLYTKEKATAEEISVIASVSELLSGEWTTSDARSRKLKALLPETRQVLALADAYAKEQARSRRDLERQLEEEERRQLTPRVSTEQLGDGIRAFLLNSGLEAMTLEELRAQVTNWLTEIAKQFASK